MLIIERSAGQIIRINDIPYSLGATTDTWAELDHLGHRIRLSKHSNCKIGTLELTLITVANGFARIGFNAPDDVKIYREEIYRHMREQDV